GGEGGGRGGRGGEEGKGQRHREGVSLSSDALRWSWQAAHRLCSIGGHALRRTIADVLTGGRRESPSGKSLRRSGDYENLPIRIYTTSCGPFISFCDRSRCRSNHPNPLPKCLIT